MVYLSSECDAVCQFAKAPCGFSNGQPLVIALFQEAALIESSSWLLGVFGLHVKEEHFAQIWDMILSLVALCVGLITVGVTFTLSALSQWLYHGIILPHKIDKVTKIVFQQNNCSKFFVCTMCVFFSFFRFK